jgi:hypothetical protein
MIIICVSLEIDLISSWICAVLYTYEELGGKLSKMRLWLAWKHQKGSGISIGHIILERLREAAGCAGK